MAFDTDLWSETLFSVLGGVVGQAGATYQGQQQQFARIGQAQMGYNYNPPNFAVAQHQLNQLARRRAQEAQQNMIRPFAAYANPKVTAVKKDNEQQRAKWRREARRTRFLGNRWNVLRIWLYTLLGVPKYTAIRHCLT